MGSTRKEWGSRPILEVLEPRLLLNGAAIGSIPSLIDPATVDQVVFAPGMSHHQISGVDGPASVMLSFVLDGTEFSDMAQFDLSPSAPGWGGDAAFALYDANGNLVKMIDADPLVATPAVETMLAEIEGRHLYVLGMYFGAASVVDYDLTVTIGAQRPNTAIVVDPTTGVGQLQAQLPEDTFNRPADVDYYELDLLNTGASGTVAVTPTGVDVQAFATLFRRTDASEPWEAIETNSDAAGNSIALALTPPTNQSLTDAEYLLAVAPVGYNTAAGSYGIEVAAAPLLGPATVNPAAATDLGTPTPTTPGTAESVVAGSLTSGMAELVEFRAPDTGEATLTFQADFQPVLSVYDETGSDLLDVVSLTAGGKVSMSLPVVAGTVYVLRCGDVDGNDGGGFELTISSPYSPQELLLTGPETQVGGLSIGIDQIPQYFRFQPTLGTDVLVIDLDRDGGAGVRVGLLGEDMGLLEWQVPQGEPLLLPVDLFGVFQSFDLYIAGTDANDVAALRIGQIDVPLELDPGLLHEGKLDLAGNLTWTQAAGSFGSVSGVKAYQVLTDPNGLTVLSGDGEYGQTPTPATPMVALYRQQGSMLRLVEYALPDELGKAEIQAELFNEEMIGLAGISLGSGGSGDIEFLWDGPELLGVGVAMVPEQVPDPNAPPAPPHTAVLKIRDVVLENDYDQHLWKTLLPFNILEVPTAVSPVITLTPLGDDLTARLTVLRADGSTFASVTNSPGQAIQFNPSPASLYAIRGQALMFRVEPVAGQPLGDGTYTIELTVETSDPMPFLMTETAWHFYVVGPPPPIDPGDVGEIDMLPDGEMVVDLVQNQFGDGWAEGEFTSSAPHDDGPSGNTGSIDVYRFWATTPGPISVRTVGIDESVNTNMRLYQARFNPAGNISYLGSIAEVSPGLGDWFPADRSVIDDQTYVNDFDLLGYKAPHNQYETNGGMYYVVVKNEQGAQGRYRIEVDVPSSPLLGGIAAGGYADAQAAEATYIPPDSGGSVVLTLPYVEDIPEFVGYFPVHVPEYHNGSLGLLSGFSFWDYDVFDAAGDPLTGSFWDAFPGTIGEFSVPSGPQTVYLRIKERTENDNAAATINISTFLNLPDGVSAPPATLPVGLAPTMLPTTPLGDGGASGSFSSAGEFQKLGFQVPAGSSTITVMPAGTAILRFEAENFTSRTTGEDPDNPGVLQDWRIIDATVDPGRTGDGEDPGFPNGAKFTNASGDRYVQVVPEAGNAFNNADGSQIDSGPQIEYEFRVPASGRYNLQIKWDGFDGGSDSLFASIVELKDGVGGSDADWYRFAHSGDSDFDTIPFQGVAAFEGTSASGGDVDATWDMLAGQTYTLRLTPREDGVAVDAMRLVLVPDLELRWGVYVGGDLIAWDQTRMVGGDFDGSTSTTLIVPDLRPPLDTPQYAYDTAPYTDAILYVEALTTPSGSGDFAVFVDSDGQLPMRSAELTIPSNSFTSSAILEFNEWLDGTDWVRLDVPSGIAGDVSLQVDLLGGFGDGTVVRYDLYGTDGSFVSSQSLLSSSRLPGTVTFNLTGTAAGGSYYLRTGMEGNTHIGVRLTASALLPKANPDFFGVPLATRNLLGEEMNQPSMKPDGTYNGAVGQPFDVNLPSILISSAFWAGTPGVATFSMTLSDSGRPWLALYRGNAEYTGSGESPTYSLELVDYVNGANVVNGNEYHLSVYIEPGMYVLKAGRAYGTGIPSYSIDIPDYVPREVVLNQNSGMSTETQYLGTDATRDGFGRYETNQFVAYRTTFFHVITPGGTQAGVTAMATTKVDNSLVPNLSAVSPHENGTASIRMYRRENSGMYFSSAESPDLPGTPHVSVGFNAAYVEPFDEFWVSLNRNYLKEKDKIGVGFEFVVPQSGDPDLTVLPLVLSPDNGQTRVDVTVANIGFASASFFSSRYHYSDTSKPSNAQPPAADILELPMGPLSTRHRALEWPPQRPNDEVVYQADFRVGVAGGDIAELDEGNNYAKDILSSVDPHAPTVTLAMEDPLMDGNSIAEIWGRYVSGVHGVMTGFVVTCDDPDGDLYRVNGRYPLRNPPEESLVGSPFMTNIEGSHSVTTLFGNYDLGTLWPTTQQNTNVFRMTARDEYGLPSHEAFRIIQVVPLPPWLDNDTSSLTYDHANYRYNLSFRNSLINVDGSLEELFAEHNIGTQDDIFLIGDLQNIILAEVMAKGTVPLDPSNDVSTAVSAHLQLQLFGAEILNETYYGADPPSYNSSKEVFVTTSLNVDGLTLKNEEIHVDAIGISFELFNKKIIGDSGEVVLFGYGIPGLVGISAKASYALNANLVGQVSVAMPTQAPHYPGLMAPTYIGLPFTASCGISGDIELFGFDVAALSGSYSISLTPAYGLNVTGGQMVAFEDFFDNSSFGVSGNMKMGIAATILGIEVWSLAPPPYVFTSSGGPVTSAPTPGELDSSVTVYSGSDSVGGIRSDPRPNLVIDPVSGEAIFVQLVDVDPTDVTRNNLAFSRREASVWGLLNEIPDANSHLSNPVLSLTYDAPGTPAMVVYQALAASNDPADRTRNQFFAGQDIRWRYFNGSTWGSEGALTSDSLYDSDPVVAFNSTGSGLAAWVHNTNAAPIDENGAFGRSANEIQVATWQPDLHTWQASQTLTADGVADGQPSVFADADGTLYVVWLRDTPAGNEVMYSINSGGGWSSPAALFMTALPEGGKISGVAIASRGPGRIDVLVAHSRQFDDNSVESRLYNRSSTAADFALPTALEIVAENANFSHLRTTQAPDGALVAYWQQGDGVTNEVFASRVGPAPAESGTWSRPIRLTSGEDIEVTPSLAVDVDDTYQVVFEQRVSPLDPPPSIQGDPTVGVVTAGRVGTSHVEMLPELGFSRAMAFGGSDMAASGTESVATARIVNRGPVGDDVLIEYIEDSADTGGPLVVASETILLAPGAEYEIVHPFIVAAGSATYSVQLTALGGGEVVGDADNVSNSQMIGMVDLAVESVELSNPQPQAGETITVMATLRNMSDQPIGPSSIGLFEGDPTIDYMPATPLNMQDIDALGGGQSTTVAFPWTVPADGGGFLLTVVADADEAINEAVETNNARRVMVEARPDALVEQTVTAAVLDYTGIHNVQVTADVRNDGFAGLTDVPVQLLWNWDEGEYQDVGSVVIPFLPAGETVQVQWTASGLTGDNRYLVLADPAMEAPETDRTNNFAQTLLTLQGFPDVEVSDAHLDSDTLPVQNEPARVLADVRNLGIDTARNVQVEVFAALHAGGGRFIIGQTVIDVIDPLTDAIVAIDIDTSRLVGELDITVVADRLQHILELTDHNNEDTFLVTFEPDTASPVVADVLVTYGPGGVKEYSIPGGAGQLDPLPWSNIGQIKIVFNENVMLEQDYLEVNSSSGESYDFADFSYDSDSFEAVWTLKEPIGADTLELVLSDDVVDALDHFLDGDWPTETGAFPSGDGRAGGSFNFEINVLPGDVDGDGEIGAGDYNAFVSEFGLRQGAVTTDFDGDGRVGLQDFVILRSRFGDTLRGRAPEAVNRTPSAPVSKQIALTDMLFVAVAGHRFDDNDERDSSVEAAPPEPSVDPSVEFPILGDYISGARPISASLLAETPCLAATTEYDLRPLSDDVAVGESDELLADILAESALALPL
jgi:hypothetical protein